MLALDLTKFVNGLSEHDKIYLAQKDFLGLPVDRKAKLFEKLLSDSGLVIVLGGASNLYSQIQNVPKTDLADVIEAVVMARRQK